MVTVERQPPKESQPGRRELLERTVHDLKNPLAVVRATLEWLEVELADRPDALDAVQDATTAAGRLMSIVDDLDAIAHLETGRAVARARVDVASVIRAVVASANQRLAIRKIVVEGACAGAMETDGDEPLLRRSIEALVDVCARGATQGACVEVAASVVRATRRDEEGDPEGTAGECGSGDTLEIAVGLRGLAPTAPPVASIDALSSGGLGAYLALRVVEAHGGSVLVVPTATVPRVLARLPY